MVSLKIDPTTGAPFGVASVPFHIEDHPIDANPRRLKIAMSGSSPPRVLLTPTSPLLTHNVPFPPVGAGFSGIIAGVRIPQRLKNIDFSIYEKNHTVGGTWSAPLSSARASWGVQQLTVGFILLTGSRMRMSGRSSRAWEYAITLADDFFSSPSRVASFSYPGLACDIPAHCYTLTFAPNPNWSHFFARASSSPLLPMLTMLTEGVPSRPGDPAIPPGHGG